MQFSLLSPAFLGSALLAVLILPVAQGGARQAVFITLNLAFLAILLTVFASSVLVFFMERKADEKAARSAARAAKRA